MSSPHLPLPQVPLKKICPGCGSRLVLAVIKQDDRFHINNTCPACAREVMSPDQLVTLRRYLEGLR